MSAVDISLDDLEPFATIDPTKAEAMIADALAMAKLVAPCIVLPEFAYPDAAKAVIRGAILRWNAADSGAVTQQSAGPFQVTVDSNTRRNGMFWPTEVVQLQSLCDRDTHKAFEVDLTPAGAGVPQESDSIWSNNSTMWTDPWGTTFP